jgi:dihydrofolate reductase
MSKVFATVGMSLDGYIAGPNADPKSPLGDGGVDIHQWAFATNAFLERHGTGGGDSTGRDNEIVEHTFQRAGAHIMGRRMFDKGEYNWPEEAPFRGPVFVLTNNPRSPWARKGGTTFYFSGDGVHAALRKAKEASGTKDVRISGGASVIQQFLNGGLVDELELQLAPLLLGKGTRLFGQVDKTKLRLEIVETINSPRVTHLHYKVVSLWSNDGNQLKRLKS